MLAIFGPQTSDEDTKQLCEQFVNTRASHAMQHPCCLHFQTNSGGRIVAQNAFTTILAGAPAASAKFLAYWFPGDEYQDGVELFFHGGPPELVLSVMQGGRLNNSVGAKCTIGGTEAVYCCTREYWAKAIKYAIGVPLFATSA